MKKTLITAFALMLFAAAANAQQHFSASEFQKNLGKTGTLCDTVYTLRIFSDTLTLLNMGAAYPNQKYTIAIRGNKVTLPWDKLKGKPLCVTGVFEMYKGKPEIEVTEPGRINAQ
jgi:hypothetical protein